MVANVFGLSLTTFRQETKKHFSINCSGKEQQNNKGHRVYTSKLTFVFEFPGPSWTSP